MRCCAVSAVLAEVIRWRFYMSFKGFPERMLPFLKENKERNDREWYFAHKPEFKTLVQEPFYALTDALSSVLQSIDPHIVTDPRRCLCHVYRDARRIKPGTSFYRDNMWTSYHRDSKLYPDAPGYYFEVTQSCLRFGLYWDPYNRSLIKSYRRYIVENAEEFRAALGRIRIFKADFEVFKKKRTEPIPHDLQVFYAAKELHFSCLDTELEHLQDPDIIETVKHAYLETSGLYEILSSLQPIQPEETDIHIPRNNITSFEW